VGKINEGRLIITMFLCEILTEQQNLPQKTSKQQYVPAEQQVVRSDDPSVQVVPDKSVQQQVVPVQQQNIPQDDMEYDEYDPDLDAEDEQVVQEVPPFQEILPIKRYYLIQRLNDLKARLDHYDIQNDDFEIIIKFMNNLSYNSLLSLSSGIIPVIEDQIARLTTNGQPQQEV